MNETATGLQTLLLNPGTPDQKALNVVPVRLESLSRARVEQARIKFGRDARLGWLDHSTNKTQEIKP